MKEVYTEVEINASASILWGVLTEFENFPNGIRLFRKSLEIRKKDQKLMFLLNHRIQMG